MTGDRGAIASQTPGYGIAITGTDPTVDLRNNILYTTQTASGGGAGATSYAMGMVTTTFANLNSINNIFWSTGANDGGFRSGSLAAASGTSYSTLALWQAAVSDDVNSSEVDPSFVNPVNDLHLTASNAIGTNIPGITEDYDCGTRNISTPDIGADEVCTGSLPASPAGLANQTRTGNGDVTFTVTDPDTGFTVEWSTDGSTNNDGTALGGVGPFTKNKTLAYPGSPPPGDPVTVVVYARISNNTTLCKSAWSYDYHGTAYNPSAQPVYGSTRYGQSNISVSNDFVDKNGELGNIPLLTKNGQDLSLLSTDALALTVTLISVVPGVPGPYDAFYRIPVSSTPVIARGLCWGPTATPDIYGSHTVDGSGVLDLTTGIPAAAGDYVRAWAINSSGLHYSNAVQITGGTK
jgi:hypothetical protein